MYCVTIERTWTKEPQEAYVFGKKKEAEDFLQEIWQDQMNAEIADDLKSVQAGEGSTLLEPFCYHEDDLAEIFFTDCTKIRFSIHPVKKAPLQKKHQVFVI